MMIKLPIQGRKDLYEVQPQKVIGLGQNYRTPEDTAQSLPPEPILFAKTPNVLIESGKPIILPKFLNDYKFEKMMVVFEAELAFFIKERCRNVSESEAYEVVYGFTCMNDVSQRNFQAMDKAGWFRGKSLDTFGPIGPRIVLREDMGDPHTLDICCRLNGEIVQKANTKDMIFSIPQMIAYISKHLTLEAGDLITSGTPAGPGPMKHGDVVEVEINGIGILKNPVIAES